MQRLIFCFIALVITIVCIVYTAPLSGDELAGHSVKIIKKSGDRPKAKIVRPETGAPGSETSYQGLIIIERSNSVYYNKRGYE